MNTPLAKHPSSLSEAQPEAVLVRCRIGDAVAARNIHAAIYDGPRYALRL